MYYVMQMAMGQSSKFIYFREEAEGYDDSLLRTGEKLKEPPPAVTLTAKEEKPTAISDLVLAPSDMLIFSPKLRTCLDEAGVTNIQYFPIRLVDRKTKQTTDEYRLANIVGAIACLDVENSEVTRLLNGKGFSAVEQFNLLEDRIRWPGTKEKPLIFRLAEFKFHVLADQSIKAICEKNKISGVEFVPTQDYA
jgi:membrane carboxypeptidase/penicillin-binding protein